MKNFLKAVAAIAAIVAIVVVIYNFMNPTAENEKPAVEPEKKPEDKEYKQKYITIHKVAN